MATPTEDVKKLRKAMAALGQSAATDPEFRKELRKNQVELIHAAGVSAALLIQLLRDEGAEEEEIAAFGFRLTAGADEPQPLHLNTHCIGMSKVAPSCLKQTISITIKVKCKVSF